MSDRFTIHHGDCIEVMRGMLDCSIDSIVTDPPYELGFMGKSWDASGIANNIDMWREALRVLKPGGHLLAFSGSRTYHRMTCAIEDAGFEIRDQIFWVYASGFPKSMNLDRLRGKDICGCQEHTKQATERNLHSVRNADVSPAMDTGEGRGQVLQQGMPEQSASAAGRPELSTCEVWGEQSGVEWWGDVAAPARELRAGEVRACAKLGTPDGAEGRLCDGASPGDGRVVRLPADEDGSGAPRGPRATEQCAPEPGTLAGQQKPQAARAWPNCARCGLPVVPQGLGTALKPAHEPICVARKPLVDTVAANVLEFGTGALNIAACRVEPTGESRERAGEASQERRYTDAGGTNFAAKHGVRGGDPAGRWPANLIHDGSDEVVALFPVTSSGAMKHEVAAYQGESATGFLRGRSGPSNQHGDSGSAARFFYCAKASRADRNEGMASGATPAVAKDATMRECETADWSTRNGNHHPTVKPTDLMAYLVRLVTPPGGLVLDMFMGSGSTGKAAMREGFQFIGIDMTPEYVAIARARIEHELARQEEATTEEKTPQMDLFSNEAVA